MPPSIAVISKNRCTGSGRKYLLAGTLVENRGNSAGFFVERHAQQLIFQHWCLVRRGRFLHRGGPDEVCIIPHRQNFRKECVAEAILRNAGRLDKLTGNPVSFSVLDRNRLGNKGRQRLLEFQLDRRFDRPRMGVKHHDWADCRVVRNINMEADCLQCTFAAAICYGECFANLVAHIDIGFPQRRTRQRIMELVKQQVFPRSVHILAALSAPCRSQCGQLFR